eukprot:11732757-Alexandrium_andersonii.AAC.1
MTTRPTLNATLPRLPRGSLAAGERSRARISLPYRIPAVAYIAVRVNAVVLRAIRPRPLHFALIVRGDE